MNAAVKLHDIGQSLWLDNITRALLASGTLARYIAGLAVTGLTSNPTIFDKAITGSADYDEQILQLLGQGIEPEPLFFELAIDDLSKAASLLRPIWDATEGIDGWVSLEVSPKLAHDTATTITMAKELHAQAGTPNLFIKIPGTPEGIPAIEEAIFAGVPINVTLLFSREHYLAAAEAYMRGLERRKEAGLDLKVGSVASLFVSRWDGAVMDQVTDDLRGQLGVGIAKRTYAAYQGVLASDRWKALAAAGANPQRLLWASTGTKDPALPDTFYIEALASSQTVNTMPEGTLIAFGAHGVVGDLLTSDGGDAEELLARFTSDGVDLDALATKLQADGADSFVASWEELISTIESKSSDLAKAN
ncbi:MAG: transaldolase [Actinomycetota bacterium]|nr:transaldolase [Actinomycetota bacterium]